MLKGRARRAERIDYQKLNSTGERHSKQQTTVESYQSSISPDTETQLAELELSHVFEQLSLVEMPTDHIIEANVIIEEIADIIDENPIYSDY